MTRPWHTLPLEVISNIFDQIGTPHQIAQCRLVCKLWDSPAEKAMYRQNLEFTNFYRLRSFHDRLAEKPSLGSLVQYIDIHDNPGKRKQLKEGLFRLAFTPNTRVVLWSYSDDDDTYKQLLDIARASKRNFKLERLPEQWGGIKFIHAQVYLHFKSTLKALHLNISKANMETTNMVLESLDEFTSLEELSLTITTFNLKQLDTIIDNCRPLKVIRISIGYYHSEEEIANSWTKDHVKASSSRCYVDLFGVENPLVVEYLVTKFPNASCVAFSPRNPWGEEENESIHPVLNALKDVNCADIECWKIQGQENWHRFISAMKSSVNHVSIRFHSDHNIRRRKSWLRRGDSVLVASAKKDRKDDTTTFDIEIPSEARRGLDTILQIIGTTTTLDIDCTDYEDDTEYTPDEQRLFLFYKVLKLVPEIQQLTFANDNIRLYLPCLTKDLHLEHLSRLTFCGALVDPALLLALDRFAPNLERLSLETCILNFTSHQSYCINMPYSKLESLSIVTATDLSSPHADWIQKRVCISKYQLVVMEVTTYSNRKVLHLALQPGKAALIKRIPQDEYLENATGCPTIAIKCNSLNWVKLNLGDLVVNVNLNTLRPIQSMDDWGLDNQQALLLSMYKK